MMFILKRRKKIVFGWVHIPYELGLHGHSDGDVLRCSGWIVFWELLAFKISGIGFPPNFTLYGVRSIFVFRGSM